MHQEVPQRMNSLLRHRPSPAMVVALISLFLSLGGVSYAVATGAIDSRAIRDNTIRSNDLRDNDVRTADLRNNDVRSRDIRNNEIRGGDIRNGTIGRADVGANALTGTNIAESTLGTVPSAATVAGLFPRDVHYTSGITTSRTTILALDGLTLQASCTGGPQVYAIGSGGTVRYFSVSGNGNVNAGSAGSSSLTSGNEGQLQITLVRSDGAHVDVALGYAGVARCAIGGHAVGG